MSLVVKPQGGHLLDITTQLLRVIRGIMPRAKGTTARLDRPKAEKRDQVRVLPQCCIAGRDPGARSEEAWDLPPLADVRRRSVDATEDGIRLPLLDEKIFVVRGPTTLAS